MARSIANSGGRTYILEHSIRADISLVKAWKADTAGNLVYRKTARNFNPLVAASGMVAVAEVELLVAAGEIDPDNVHTPGIYIDRIVHCPVQQKRIEQRTTRGAN
jgi:3-oxoacid CoA-transferase subunit A